ncbi:MAG: pyridoxamine 5'-phosphate oxidase family protein [Pseudomonadota bacterium]
MAASEGEFETLRDRLFDSFPVAHLATLSDDQRPDTTPVVFARVGESFWSPIDGKPKSRVRLARLERITRAPRVTIVLDHYDDDWTALWWVRVQCRGEVIEGAHDNWGEAKRALQAKYAQYALVPLLQEEPIMIRFEWEAISWWGMQGLQSISDWLDN